MADEGWEARMAARAAARRVERPQDFWDWDAVLSSRERYLQALGYIRSTQTLADALAELRGPGIACACSGDPCCIDWYANARQMQRTAHIIARQLSDLAEKRERSQ